MTVALTQAGYIKGLATHYASVSRNPSYPPMGLRFRLRATFNCATLRLQARVVCVALQKYGAIIADNGANWFLTGEANINWNTPELSDIKYTNSRCINRSSLYRK